MEKTIVQGRIAHLIMVHKINAQKLPQHKMA